MQVEERGRTGVPHDVRPPLLRARPPVGHVARPPWWGRENEIPKIKRVEDMTFGERV